MNEEHDELSRWIEELRAELEVEDDVDVGVILDAARVVAHTVERRAAPVTAYVMGLAARTGQASEIAGRVVDLARSHRQGHT